MLTEDRLFDFVKKCASSYCRRYGFKQYDDARQNAAAFLLSRRDLWNSSDAYLKIRVYGYLIRTYQNAAGLRRKKRLLQTGRVDERTVDARDCYAEIDNRDEARYLITRAAINAGLVEFLPLLLFLGAGNTQNCAAAAFRLPLGTVNRIYCRFAFEMRKLDTQRGVRLVEPRNIDGSTPLFGEKTK